MKTPLLVTLRFYSFCGLFLLWNLVLAIGGLWFLLLPRAAMFAFVRFYLGGIGVLFRVVAGVKLRVIGRENIPATPCILAAKHLAPWETMVLPLLGRSPAIVLKQELMRIPLWGWYAWKYGNVPVDRGGKGRTMVKMLAAAKLVLEQGRDLLIFPQGTRLNLGEWQPYKIGVAGIYQALQVPIVPVALNSGVFWTRQGRLRRTGTVTIEFLPAIPAGLSRSVILAQLQEQIETATNRLVAAEGGETVPMPLPNARKDTFVVESVV